MTMMPAIKRLGVLALTALASALSAAATPSAGCTQTLASGVYGMTDQSVTRFYRVLVPSHYKPGSALPLIIVFHGWGGDENEFLDDAHVTSLADERNYIIVAPRGLGSAAPDANRNSWSFSGSTTGVDGSGGAICDPAHTTSFAYPSCKNIARNTCSWTQCQADDGAFTLALVHEIESKLCVDTARIFAAGGSNGAMFTWDLGRSPATAPTFRAIAALIGLPHRGYLAAPAKAGGLPVLVITGTHDTTVPPGAWESTRYTTTHDGGAYYYSSASAMSRSWGPANSCPYEGKAATPFDTGAPEADCRTYCSANARGWSGDSARPGWPHVLDCRAAMGHDYQFNWSWKLILDFFDAQS